jgi:hypothetical protein
VTSHPGTKQGRGPRPHDRPANNRPCRGRRICFRAFRRSLHIARRLVTAVVPAHQRVVYKRIASHSELQRTGGLVSRRPHAAAGLYQSAPTRRRACIKAPPRRHHLVRNLTCVSLHSGIGVHRLEPVLASAPVSSALVVHTGKHKQLFCRLSSTGCSTAGCFARSVVKDASDPTITQQIEVPALAAAPAP